MATADENGLEAALRRLDRGLDGVRRAVEISSEVTFQDVDFTASSAPSARDDAEFKRSLADAMNEWHEDYGWATTMPEDVRSDLIARVRAHLGDEQRRG